MSDAAIIVFTLVVSFLFFVLGVFLGVYSVHQDIKNVLNAYDSRQGAETITVNRLRIILRRLMGD